MDSLDETKELDDGRDEQPDGVSLKTHSVQERDAWVKRREQLIEDMGRPSFVAATSLGSRLREDKGEQESSEPWRRGRAGTSVGRAVHAVLQSIDQASGKGYR